MAADGSDHPGGALHRALERTLDRVLGWVAGSRLLRAVLALAILGGHLLLMKEAGWHWLHQPFNAEPGKAPSYVAPTTPVNEVSHKHRLLPSRWDAGHYLTIALSGYRRCPPQDLRGGNLRALTPRCDLEFYPGYSLLGEGVAAVTRLPMDWALLAVTLAASFLALFLWTGPDMVALLGRGEAFLSLFLVATFPSAFHLVSLHPESLLVAGALAGMVALRRRAYAIGALAVGTATAIHVRALAFAGAYALALLVSCRHDRPRSRAHLAGRLLLAPVTLWGQASLSIYYWLRYRDPLLYYHVKQAVRWVPLAFDGTLRFELVTAFRPPFAGPVLIMVAFATALGARRFLARLTPAERIYAVLGSLVTISLSLFSRKGDWISMTRYLLAVPPLFAAMACALRGKLAALAVWTFLCGLLYWSTEICVYLAQNTQLAKCPAYH